MKPTIPLLLDAIAFTLFWSGLLLWASGTDEPSTILLFVLCCSVTGFCWYWLMSWCFRMMRLLPDQEVRSGTAH